MKVADFSCRVLDWYSFIKQHNPTPPGFETGAGGAYETPLRDRQMGRIYRLVWKYAQPYGTSDQS